MLDGPPQGPGEWVDQDHVRTCLAGHKHESCLNARVPVVLPAELTVSSIEHRMDRMGGLPLTFGEIIDCALQL